jgi:hypothetical protein
LGAVLIGILAVRHGALGAAVAHVIAAALVSMPLHALVARRVAQEDRLHALQAEANAQIS